jgi:hypothetical protein
MTCDAHDRIVKVQSFDARQCRQALRLSDLQKTVRLAVERRLRKLWKQLRNTHGNPTPP